MKRDAQTIAKYVSRFTFYVSRFMLVSVIIPTFNRKEFLREAIDSVLAQSYKNFQLIVIDDGSIDGTAELVTRYGKALTYFYQENQGVSAARNKGIGLAQGELISFLDSDDLWTKRKLEAQVEFMTTHPEARICYTDEIWIRRGVRVNPMKHHQKYSGWIFDKTLPLCIVSPSSVMMRRELFQEIGRFDESLPVCEDYDLWLRVAAVYPIYFIEQKLIVKRGGHPDQLSRRAWGNDIYRIKALEKILAQGRLTIEQRALVLQHIKEKCRVLENGFFKRGKLAESEVYRRKIDEADLNRGRMHHGML